MDHERVSRALEAWFRSHDWDGAGFLTEAHFHEAILCAIDIAGAPLVSTDLFEAMVLVETRFPVPLHKGLLHQQIRLASELGASLSRFEATRQLRDSRSHD